MNYWVDEFGADYEVPKELISNPRLVDSSWHNDICPSFSVVDDMSEVFKLWVDHPFPHMREANSQMETPRYFITDASKDFAVVFSSEWDVDAAIAKLLELVDGQ